MTYNLAVWKGERPASDEEALKTYQSLYDEWLARGAPNRSSAPVTEIAAYVESLLQRWPDISTDEGEDSPWADGPLIDDASGPIIYFPIMSRMCEEASEFAAQVAAKHGLVCFDPQMSELRP